MSYEAEISRSNPTCFLLLLDQSGSMAEPFGAESAKTKAQGVADAVNRLVETLVLRCSKGEQILDRYYIGMIGYGGDVSQGFPIDALAGEVLQPVSRIDANPLCIEQRVSKEQDRTGKWVERHDDSPVWFEPKAQGKTLMCKALRAAREVVGDFVDRHPCCFPPIVINITDGMATDGLFEPEALNLWRLASQDGNVLLFNIHISARGERPTLFPSDNLSLSDDYARRLFTVSSPLPQAMFRQAKILEATLEEGARGFAFNADLSSVISFLDIGTRVGPGAQ
jgi:uncharacterized protein YegL